MLASTKIQRRQSEIRQKLAEICGIDEPSTEQRSEIEALDTEYRSNETRLRGALIAETAERQDAEKALETRSDREWSDLMDKFEVRQIVTALDEGRELSGQTAEIVQEMRSSGSYRGMPIPWAALERRSGETIASGTPDPKRTAPIIDRLFPSSVAGRMGIQAVTIDQGLMEYPVTSSAVSAGWAASETGAVASPTAYATIDRSLAPDHTLGVQMKVTRKSLKQSGAALEQAIRRDMAGAIQAELDKAVFLGSGSNGEPLGLLTGASTYGIAETDVNADPTWAAFRQAIVRFMTGNAASAPTDVRLAIRPEVWSDLDDALISGTGISEWDRLANAIGAENVVTTSNGLAAPDLSPLQTSAILTTSAGGVAPGYLGLFGGIDVIRDVYSDAASGGLRLTGLVTADVTVARASQVEVLHGLYLGV